MPLVERSQTLIHEDLGDVMTVLDVAKKPFKTMVKKGKKLTAMLFHDPVNKLQDARLGGVPDGTAINRSTLADPSVNRGKIGGRGQVFERDLGVGFIAQSVSDVAGVADEYAQGVSDKLTEVAGDLELTCLSDQESRDSSSSAVSDLTRGLGYSINDGAPIDTEAGIPALYRTPAAQIKNVASVGAFAKADLDALLLAVNNSSGGGFATLHGFVTNRLLNVVNGFFEKFTPTSTELPLNRYTQNGDSDTIKHAVTHYVNAFAEVFFLPSQYLGGVRSYTGTSGLAATVTSGSAAVTLGAAFTDYKGNAGIQVGMRVYGTGIPAGTTISAVNSNGTGLTLSANASANGTLIYLGDIQHGHLVQMESLQFRSSLEPGHTNLAPDGAGDHGFIRAIGGLQNTNPTHHAKIVTRAAAES